MSDAYWQSVLATKTFNSVKGRELQREAKSKLKKLDAKLGPEVLRKVVAFYLREAPYDLWPALKGLRAEHAGVVVEALEGDGSLQADLARESFARDGALGIQRVGELLAATARSSHVGGLWKSMAKNWDTLPCAALAPATNAVLARRTREPDLTEGLAFGALVFILARALPDSTALDQARKVCAKKEYWTDIVERARVAAA